MAVAALALAVGLVFLAGPAFESPALAAPQTQQPSINWGQPRPSDLGPDEAYLVLADLTNCREPENNAGVKACRLPQVTNTEGRSYSFDYCWNDFVYDGDLYDVLQFDGASWWSIRRIDGYPWDGGNGFDEQVTDANLRDTTCAKLHQYDPDTPAIIKYYRISHLALRCANDPKATGNRPSLTVMSNDCYLVGLARMPADAAPPSPGSSGSGSSSADGGFASHICVGSACGFLEIVDNFLRWLSYLVVPLIIIMIIYGGISLSLAGDNPEATRKAKARITQAIVALICFGLLWGFLKWLIP